MVEMQTTTIVEFGRTSRAAGADRRTHMNKRFEKDLPRKRAHIDKVNLEVPPVVTWIASRIEEPMEAFTGGTAVPTYTGGMVSIYSEMWE